MKNRREFILQSAVCGAVGLGAVRHVMASEKDPAAKPLRMLLLGATHYIGPHFLRTALARGHAVSVFVRPNKDKTPPALPGGVETLLGDRNGDLESIEERDWDAVLDLAVYSPEWVRTLAAALQSRVGRYLFISTMALYREWYENPLGKRIIDESSPVFEYAGEEFPQHWAYGGQKVICEREAAAKFPGRTLILRPSSGGYIRLVQTAARRLAGQVQPRVSEKQRRHGIRICAGLVGALYGA